MLGALGPSEQGFGGTGWWIEVEAEVRLGQALVVPDLAGWRVERVPELPEDNPIAIIPDWCCEVLSPSTARDDKRLKLPLFDRSGVSWVWLVDPLWRHAVRARRTGGRIARAAAIDGRAAAIDGRAAAIDGRAPRVQRGGAREV